jgi:putative ABC transport system permease protein
MILHWLRISLRHAVRYKGYTLIFVAGLALAMAASLLIMLHVGEELSFERCFPKADRIDRVIREMYDPPGAVAKVCPPLGRTMQQLLPGVEQWARFHPLEERTWRWRSAEKSVARLRIDGGYFVDPAALQMFDLHFIAGDPLRALARPDAVVLTAALARKCFPGREPIGETLVDEATNTAFTITGVVEDLPAATHLRFSYLLPMETLFALLNQMGETGMDDNRFWDGMYMYILRSPGVTREQLEKGVPDLTAANFGGGGRSRSQILARTRYRLQPITDIHLHSKLIQEMGPNSDIAYVYIFSAIAVLILLIAVANFINLSTALAFKRMREIGVKKVLGATRRNLIGQYLVEAFGYILAAGLLALLLVQLAAPLYSELAGRPLPGNVLPSFAQIGWGALAVLLLTLLAGGYPALYLARFRPAHTLKGLHTPFSASSYLRKGLVVFQFVISVLMIFGTLVIHRQMDYFHKQDLGFDRVNVVAIPLQGQLAQEIAVRGETLKTEFRKLAGVRQVSLADNLPGDGTDFSLEPLRLEGEPEDNRRPSFRWMRVDEDFLSTLGISLVAGRGFGRMAPNTTAFIVNQTAANMLGRPDPVGLRAVSPNTKADIIGVVEDFKFASLHNQVEPLVLHYQPARARYMLVKLQPGQAGPALASLRRRMAELVPDHLFDYALLDDKLNRLYVAEDRIGRLFALFAGLGIVIACLGLLGLSAYSAEVRTKEIGIRKVLGATAGGIVWMLTSEYCRWVMLASAVALAGGYYLMSRWLEQFAYRTTIDPGVFIATGLIAAVTALAAVSGQALRAARSQPVKALRYE